MNRNNMPLILMLVTGLITCVISFIRRFEFLNMALALFFSLLISFVLGSMIKGMLNYFDRQNELKSMEAGEVIEKESETPESEKSETILKSEGTVKSE